jgi:enamine deaminase RidA (YjgF/YER057c/UK114 family)
VIVPSIDFLTPADLPAPAGYSHVAVVEPGHRLVWTSGQVALDADGNVVGVPDDWEAQTRAVMQNLARALGAAGAGWSDVFKLTIFVTDTSELSTIRRVRDEFVDPRRPPTSSLVRVAGLFLPDLLIEVEALAAVADPQGPTHG